MRRGGAAPARTPCGSSTPRAGEARVDPASSGVAPVSARVELVP
jgi:hypothetical protein